MLDRTTFKPRPGSPVSLKSSDEVPYTPGPLAVSPDGSRVATLALGIINNKRGFILCLVDVTAMQLVRRVQVGTGYSNAPPVTTTGITYSLDGEYLFVFGTNYATDPPQPESTVLSVYDADSLQELEWSPIPVTKFYGNFVMAPDGSRFYVSTYDTGTGTMGKVIELVPYFPAAAVAIRELGRAIITAALAATSRFLPHGGQPDHADRPDTNQAIDLDGRTREIRRGQFAGEQPRPAPQGFHVGLRSIALGAERSGRRPTDRQPSFARSEAAAESNVDCAEPCVRPHTSACVWNDRARRAGERDACSAARSSSSCVSGTTTARFSSGGSVRATARTQAT